MQPDTLIPDQNNPQNWNRFSYVQNNPIRYIDPSGHDGGELFIVSALIFAVVFIYDVSRRHGSDNYCDGTLSECFNNIELKKFSNNQAVDTQEFHDMLGAINDNLHQKWRTRYDPARSDYDTPFYDGNDKKNDHVVCIENKCSPQSAVNYVAQGMYSAYTGQSLEDAKDLADSWNKIMHWHPATEDEKYWVAYGYNYYNSINKKKGSSYKPKTIKNIVGSPQSI